MWGRDGSSKNPHVNARRAMPGAGPAQKREITKRTHLRVWLTYLNEAYLSQPQHLTSLEGHRFQSPRNIICGFCAGLRVYRTHFRAYLDPPTRREWPPSFHTSRAPIHAAPSVCLARRPGKKMAPAVLMNDSGHSERGTTASMLLVKFTGPQSKPEPKIPSPRPVIPLAATIVVRSTPHARVDRVMGPNPAAGRQSMWSGSTQTLPYGCVRFCHQGKCYRANKAPASPPAGPCSKPGLSACSW